MREQVMNQFRCDRQLREDCVAIYEAMGMDLNTAFRMFMERTRIVRGLPFPAVLPEEKAALTTTLPAEKITPAEARRAFEVARQQAADMPEMTLEEINEEIRAARRERKERAAKQ